MYSLVGRGLFRGEGGEAAQPWPPSLLDQAFPAPPLTKEPKSGMNLEQNLNGLRQQSCHNLVVITGYIIHGLTYIKIGLIWG